MNIAFDLTTAVNSLDKNGAHRDFITAVKKFDAAVSVELDLQSVARSVAVLETLNNSADTPEKSHLGLAMITHAVITYARATDTEAIQRFKVGVTKGYTQSQRVTHNEILDLRNRCLAHFGPGKDMWHDERVVYVEMDEGAGITSVNRRTHFTNKLTSDLKELCEKALSNAELLQIARADELSELISKVSPELDAIIDSHIFDVADFFKESPEAARKFFGRRSFAEIRYSK